MTVFEHKYTAVENLYTTKFIIVLGFIISKEMPSLIFSGIFINSIRILRFKKLSIITFFFSDY